MKDGEQNLSRKRRALKITAIVCISLVALFVALYFTPFFVMLAGEKTDIVGDPKIMIVFGYKLDGDDMPSLLKNRLDVALEYLQTHDDVSVILSGGGDGDNTEAKRMFDYLTAHGVGEDVLYLEERSTTTVENVIFSAELIKEEGLNSSNGVLLVSNDFHLARIKMLCKRLNAPAPFSTLAAPSSPPSQKAMMYLREPFALIFDFLSA